MTNQPDIPRILAPNANALVQAILTITNDVPGDGKDVYWNVYADKLYFFDALDQPLGVISFRKD